jgi:hypothetical protein
MEGFLSHLIIDFNMLKKVFIFLVTLTVAYNIHAQNSFIKGTVKDATTGESLIGANIVYVEGKGMVTDIDGNFSFELPNGEYTITVSYVGYQTDAKKIKVQGKNIQMTFELKTLTLSEVQVVGNVAKTRETPVAFTSVTPAKLDEKLAARDIPMILNSTPGVYATQQGGGDGDSRINIRGFSQTNVAVMIDGIPVNDMENGWVYWSNWFGLDAVTRSIQVQRGLGASKLAIPSVGGTMNIVTKGIESKKEILVKEEVTSSGLFRTSLGYNSGKLKHDWAVSLAGSYKQGNGWVDETYSKGYFYYMKVDKKIGKHILSISAMGAPQQHSQRKYTLPIATYDKAYAAKLGVDTSKTNYYLASSIDTVHQVNKGLTYNQHWGYLEKYTLENGDTVHADKKKVDEAVNYYHKPEFSIRDFWRVNDKLYISNIAYLSIGTGGGTSLKKSVAVNYANPKNSDIDADGQINFQKFYNTNAYGTYSIDNAYSATEHKSYNFIRSAVNDHFWYGLLSTFNYTLSKQFTLSGGLDLRSYKGEHYEQVYDLLGGDYMIDNYDSTQTSKVKRVGDKIYYHDAGFVKWGGIFAQGEYKTGNISTFLNLSCAYSGYKKIDYFKIVMRESDWKWIPGYTVKGGINYNLNEHMNVYTNLGYLSKAPVFDGVYEKSTIKLLRDIRNELIKAFELGYNYNYSKFNCNINGYLTQWKNKPGKTFNVKLSDEESGTANIQGMDAFHKGVELDFSYKITKKLEWEGLVSIGDWRWTSADTVKIYKDNGEQAQMTNPTTGLLEPAQFYFNAKNVHVGDAAQTQLGATLRYEPIKNLYFGGSITFFDRYYAQFDPFSLTGDAASLDAKGNPIDSWEAPSYYLVDFNTGYKFKIKKFGFNIRFNLLNAFNKEYISDALDDDSYATNTRGHDAKSASVFFGMGRTFTTSLQISF